MRIFGREESAPKRFRDGTHRTRSPAETLAWLAPAAKAAGVTRLADVTGLDSIGVPVWTAIRPNGRGLATSQGKGLTHEAAKVSALMEAVESWHAETIDRPLRQCAPARAEQLGGAVDVHELSYYEASPPRADLALTWIEGSDLVSGQPCWVPLECVSTDYVVGASGSLQSTFVQSSNGLAGGNHILEAICHAVAELVERHAIAANSERIRTFDRAIRVDCATIEDQQCATLLARLEAAGLLTAVFHLPSEIGIPAFACSIVDRDSGLRWRSLPPFNGYGCHLEPAIALARAVSEAIQSRLTYIAGSRDDIAFEEYERGGSPDDLASFRALLEDDRGSLPFRAFQGRSADTFEADVSLYLEGLEQAGFAQVVVVDLTKPELSVPVVKAVVPGLAAPFTLIRGGEVRVPPPRHMAAA